MKCGFVVRVSSLVSRCCFDLTIRTGSRVPHYLVNASGAFTTNARKCGEEAVLLRRVLSRLIELDDDDDDELGMLASLNEVDDVLGTFVVSDKLLPPRAHDFESELGDLRDLEIQEFLTRRRICRRLTTSACYAIARHAPVDPTAITPITSTSPTPAVEYAITFVWAEHSLLDDGIALHRKMHAASRADTEGLSLSAGIYRGDLRTLPTFLGVDENFDGIEPRALEVVFIRQSYWPLSTTRTTKELAQAVLGVVKGLRNLAEPQQPLRVDHERWHDIESLFYLVMEISFREPYMGDDQVLVMTPVGETFWGYWNRQEADLVYDLKELLRLNHRYHKLLKGCAQRWTNIKQLVDILRSNFGLDNRFIGLEVAMEEDQLGELWGPSGTMSHESIISEIERLLPSL
ncbi:BQ5605_C027g10310 [Microbotryum silenes-dioicae]|uniref:BQ5605_C027g10310 protein n=1 Tax=Microbotryum silenes-dioicae TaxID=796604 RepID=A0A2X0N9C0_9BASI|nr:BQ5605_C027g10310 [Microbotryum silenes-dioicae]